MRPLSRVLLVLAASVAFYGASACSTEDPGAELNPQPLPPGDQNPGNQKTSEPAPAENSDNTGGSTSSGSSGGVGASSSGGTNPGVPDGGGDAGTDAGGDN